MRCDACVRVGGCVPRMAHRPPTLEARHGGKRRSGVAATCVRVRARMRVHLGVRVCACAHAHVCTCGALARRDTQEHSAASRVGEGQRERLRGHAEVRSPERHEAAARPRSALRLRTRARARALHGALPRRTCSPPRSPQPSRALALAEPRPTAPSLLSSATAHRRCAWRKRSTFARLLAPCARCAPRPRTPRVCYRLMGHPRVLGRSGTIGYQGSAPGSLDVCSQRCAARRGRPSQAGDRTAASRERRRPGGRQQRGVRLCMRARVAPAKVCGIRSIWTEARRASGSATKPHSKPL